MADIRKLKLHPTYTAIANKLSSFSPGIDIGKYIYNDLLEVAGNTLDGISFKANNTEKLKYALRNILDVHGEKAFAEGHKEDMSHWALAKSFSKTHGIGFREIWRPKLAERALSIDDGRPTRFKSAWDRHSSAGFGDAMDVPDLSSVHCAIADDICNIHIDQMGFVMSGVNGDLVVNPDFLRHYIIELLWKTEAKKKLPGWVVEHVNFILPSSYNDYSRIGLSLDAQLSQHAKISLSGTCTLHGAFECSANLTVSGTHDLFGKSWRR